MKKPKLFFEEPKGYMFWGDVNNKNQTNDADGCIDVGLPNVMLICNPHSAN